MSFIVDTGSTILDTSSALLNNGRSVIANEFSQFLEFISGANIVQVGTALLITNQITILFANIMTDLIAPIISRLTGSNDEFKQYHLTIFGVKFKIGDFILSFLNFMIILLMIYYLVRLIPASSKISINNILPIKK
jgi:large conductance mechanosensitive channel